MSDFDEYQPPTQSLSAEKLKQWQTLPHQTQKVINLMGVSIEQYLETLELENLEKLRTMRQR